MLELSKYFHVALTLLENNHEHNIDKKHVTVWIWWNCPILICFWKPNTNPGSSEINVGINCVSNSKPSRKFYHLKSTL